LQKTIFRSHNEGDSVKISLPVENVIDIEVSPVVEFAETVKIRVIESGESYAIDDVSPSMIPATQASTDQHSISSPFSAMGMMPSMLWEA
jgi:hypothetical protein